MIWRWVWTTDRNEPCLYSDVRHCVSAQSQVAPYTPILTPRTEDYSIRSFALASAIDRHCVQTSMPPVVGLAGDNSRERRSWGNSAKSYVVLAGTPSGVNNQNPTCDISDEVEQYAPSFAGIPRILYAFRGRAAVEDGSRNLRSQ